MALKYRIPYSNVPSWWRNSIDPQSDEQGQYYDIEQLCEDGKGVICPISNTEREKYQTENTGLTTYIKYLHNSSTGSGLQKTISELKVNDTEFLALCGGTPTLYFDGQTGVNTTTFSFGNYSNNWGGYGFVENHQGGMICQTIYKRARWGSDDFIVNSDLSRRYYFWAEGDGLYVKDNSTSQVHGPMYPAHHYVNCLSAVNVLIIAAGGSGHTGSVGHNGAGGGAGAFGIFQVNLIDTSASNPIVIDLGGNSRDDENGIDSHIWYHYSGGTTRGIIDPAYTEGYTIGAGKAGESNHNVKLGGDGGVISNYQGNTKHLRIIKLYDEPGAASGENIIAHSITKNNTKINITNHPGINGNGGPSVACDGGSVGYFSLSTPPATTPADTTPSGPGAGGGGGAGPNAYDCGKGGCGGYSWFGIIY